MGKEAPKDAMWNALSNKLITPQVITSGGGAKSGVLNIQAGAGAYGALLEIQVGASGDTLSGSVKHTITLLEGDASDGSDAVLVADPMAVMGPAGVGKNAQGGDFAAGVVAVIDAADEDDTTYAIQYHGTKPVVKLTITPSAGNTNGTPMSATATLLNPRKQGAAENF